MSKESKKKWEGGAQQVKVWGAQVRQRGEPGSNQNI